MCRLATTDGTTSFAFFPGLLPLFPLHRALTPTPLGLSTFLLLPTLFLSHDS